jgi:type IV secretion system protein VirB11
MRTGLPASASKAFLPPVALGPCFSIRKPAARIYSLLDYVRDGVMSAEAARLLSIAAIERRNILIAGGTSSGKTTLANALLAEVAALGERVILIEDTRELQSAAPDTVALRTRPGRGHNGGPGPIHAAPRPDRIIVGEVGAARRSTCSRPGTPVIQAGSQPCTRTAR